MPETDLEAVQTALGNMCIIVDGNQQHETSKLRSVEPGSVESFYMVAACCFDLYRKLHYIFKATREFAREEYTDGDIAREVKGDNDRLYESRAGMTWKERAERAEKALLRLYEEIHEEHEALLQAAAKKR